MENGLFLSGLNGRGKMSIKWKADTRKMTCKEFGFYIEPIVTEEGRHYIIYKNLNNGEIYINDIGKKHGGFDFYLFDDDMATEENLKKALYEIIEKANNEGNVYYPESH